MRRVRVRSVTRFLLALLLLYVLRDLPAWLDSRADMQPWNPRQPGVLQPGDLQQADMQPGLLQPRVPPSAPQEEERRRQVEVEEPSRQDVAKGAEVELEKRANVTELCPAGSFRLLGMESCVPWLGCGEIAAEVTVRELCDWGGVKKIYRATWRGHTVAYLNLTRKHFPWRDFFLNHVTMLQRLQSGHVVQLVGWCNTTLVTEYHRLGSADRIEDVLSSGEFSRYNTVRTRFGLALSYVQTMHYLHNSPVGTRVLCDSNRLKKTLSQFLITEELRLVLNDLDSVLKADAEDKLFMRCNFNRIDHKSDFSAPEQRRPFQHGRLNYSRMPPYDEKMDIWKIPTVVDYLLGNVTGSDVVRLNLLNVHRKCKYKHPKQRPSARILLKEYKRVGNMFFLNPL